MATVTSWLQERPALEVVQLNRKLQVLLAGGITLDDPSETQREEMDMKLKIVGSGTRVVGIPVETEAFQREFAAETMRGE